MNLFNHVKLFNWVEESCAINSILQRALFKWSRLNQDAALTEGLVEAGDSRRHPHRFSWTSRFLSLIELLLLVSISSIN